MDYVRCSYGKKQFWFMFLFFFLILVADEFDVQAEADLRREKQVPANYISRIHWSFSSSRHGRCVSSRQKLSSNKSSNLASHCKGKMLQKRHWSLSTLHSQCLLIQSALKWKCKYEELCTLSILLSALDILVSSSFSFETYMTKNSGNRAGSKKTFSRVCDYEIWFI